MKKYIPLFILILILSFTSACEPEALTGTDPTGIAPTEPAPTIPASTKTSAPTDPGASLTAFPGATLTPAPPAWKSLDDRARLTAFYSDKGVFLAYFDGTNPIRLGSIGYHYVLKWSPDGQKLVFSPDQYHFTILDLLSGSLRQIETTDAILLINWHPASAMIAVMVAMKDEYALYDAETGSFLRWLPGTYMSFSPDGTRVAYSYQNTGLFIQAIDVNSTTGLIEGTGEPISNPINDDIWAILVVWSPRGDLLAFTGIKKIDGLTGLYVATVNDDRIGNPYRLTGTDFGSIGEFIFSPNGGMLAFPAALPYTYGIPHMYITNIDGSGMKNLTQGRDVVDYCPNFSDDGSQFTFSLNGDLHRYKPGSGLPPKPILEEADATCQAVRPGGGLLISTCADDFTRLEIGGQAIVGGDESSPNRVRSAPEKGENVISYLAVGAMMRILEGPVCADGFVFWRVENDSIPGGSGWTAEGDGTGYWLVPYQP